jgi:hypothetical protein
VVLTRRALTERPAPPDVSALAAELRRLLDPIAGEIRARDEAHGRQISDLVATLAEHREILDGLLRHQTAISRGLGVIDTKPPTPTWTLPLG